MRAFALQSLDKGLLCRAAQLISTVMIWFFFQGNGCADVALSADELVFGSFCDNVALCLGGIAGSLFFLLGDLTQRHPVAWGKGVVAALVLLSVSALASFVLGIQHYFVAATVSRTITSAIITVLFLHACIPFVGTPIKEVLGVFLVVSLFRIVQCALFLIPFSATAGVMFFGTVMYALLVPYVIAARRVGDFSVETTSSYCEIPASSDEIVESASRLPWQFILHVMLFYFAINIASSWEVTLISGVVSASVPYLLGTVTSFVLFYFVFMRKGDTSEYWARMRQITFPLIYLAFLIICLSSSEGAYFGAVLLAQSAYRFYLLSSYVEMFSIMSITRIRPHHVLAVTHIAMYCGMLLGSLYSLPIQKHIPGDGDYVLGTMAIVFVCLIVGSCWLGTDKQAAKVWGRRVEMTPQGKHNELARRKCELIAKRYALTSKEAEVLALLAEGKQTAQIASQMFVTKNTVRTHLRNLYNKLDVHSREEALAFFDAYAE